MRLQSSEMLASSPYHLRISKFLQAAKKYDSRQFSNEEIHEAKFTLHKQNAAKNSVQYFSIGMKALSFSFCSKSRDMRLNFFLSFIR
jgi:ribosomal 50S subunit-recycling heat shock protein